MENNEIKAARDAVELYTAVELQRLLDWTHSNLDTRPDLTSKLKLPTLKKETPSNELEILWQISHYFFTHKCNE